MLNTKKDILVYAHWEGMHAPVLMGILTSARVKGKETFSFN